ncbi:MAG: MFS transporter [Ignavibacteria bacterium]|nr:MFS transporter [Ignavibacteria bacterium]
MKSSGEKLSLNFIIVWLGQLVSTIGSGLTAFSFGIYVFHKTNTATSYSLIILFAFLPAFLLQPIGGTLSDRIDRRLMMIIGDFGSALGLVFILLMMYSGIDDLWVIYTGVAFSAIFVALQNPAYRASVTDLLDEGAYSRASGLMQMAESSRFLISPIVAGILLSFWNIKNILIIDIFTFITAIAAVFFIRKNLTKSKTNTAHQSFFSDLAEGFKYTFAHKGLFWLLIVASLLTFFVGFFQTLFGPMILSFTDSKTLGTSLTLMASGMLISSIIVGVFSIKKRHLFILSAALAVSGFFYALIGFSTNIIFLVVMGFLFFVSLPFVNTCLDVLIRKNVDNNIQGRIWSIVSVISQFGTVIAFASAGILADYIFNPLFKPDGALAPTFGKITGIGPGRGIAFMFILSGIFIVIISGIIGRIKVIKALDCEHID